MTSLPTDPLAELDIEHPWQRLDPRMLLVYPVREVGRFIIPLAFLFVSGTATGSAWQFLSIVVPVALGLLRYFTTRYRIAEGRVELRRGLLSRTTLSAPIDRVRSVDLTASPIHRILGVTTVRIGTGSSGSSEELDLDGLPVDRAHQLRQQLLAEAAVPRSDAPKGETADDPAVPPPSVPRAAAEFHPSWLRFAPFTSSGLIIAAALIGVGSQVGDQLGIYDRLDRDDFELSVPIWLIVLVVALGLAVASIVLSVVGYAVTNFGYRLQHSDGTWHLSRGLLTTRETSLDEERLAGVALGEPLGLRLAGGARLLAIATGLRAGAQETSVLVPPAPRRTVEHAAIEVCGREAPVLGDLVAHGPAARRRRFVRALTPAAALAAAPVLVVVLTGAPWWIALIAPVLLLAALGLAVDRARGLGHGLVDGYVVARSGSLMRRRELVRVEDVIGWNLRATWFQRRVGLTTVSATTAGGSQSVTLLDVPEDVAIRLTSTAMPALVNQFVGSAS